MKLLGIGQSAVTPIARSTPSASPRQRSGMAFCYRREVGAGKTPRFDEFPKC